MNDYISYFRKDIDEMTGYQPGEQLNVPNLLKLNTNESPYPPSPLVCEALRTIDYAKLRLYPNPNSDMARDELARVLCLTRDEIICGNGSDDILSMVIRCFTSPTMPVACMRPSYTLYPTLAKLNGTPIKYIELTETFDLPPTLLEEAEGANLLVIASPNAPTGNEYSQEKIDYICSNFKGMVLIDEAYGDFAWFNSLNLHQKHTNLILSRTFSKSRSLAGLRFGYAIAHPKVIEGLLKMKDSYNVSYLTQLLATASLRDSEYFTECVEKIRYDREILKAGLMEIGFKVVNSATNFLFATPPDRDGERCFRELRARNILVRYFPGERTGEYVRITVGTHENVKYLLKVFKEIYGG